jgi:hypothetical protein
MTFDSSLALCRASVPGPENRHGLDAPSCAGPGSQSCSASW